MSRSAARHVRSHAKSNKLYSSDVQVKFRYDPTVIEPGGAMVWIFGWTSVHHVVNFVADFGKVPLPVGNRIVLIY